MNKKYRKTIIAGNWKMNMSVSETRAYTEAIKPILPRGKWCEIVLCVPAVNITPTIKLFKNTRIAIGAQNLHYESSGAFTGEVSAEMLEDLGIKYVVVGHSERRQYYNEVDITVNKKVHAALDADISPIICVGEALVQREMGVTSDYISYQVKMALSGVRTDKVRHVILAYEPLWAIGTGHTASPQQAGEVCAHIRAVIRKLYGARIARAITILYGGSMNAKNAADLLAQPDVDGGLIGGASLIPEDFVAIINAANQKQV